MLCATCSRADGDSRADGAYYCTARRGWIPLRGTCSFYDHFEATPIPELLEASLGLLQAMAINRRWPKDTSVRERLAERAVAYVLIARGYAVTARRVRLYTNQVLRRIFGHLS